MVSEAWNRLLVLQNEDVPGVGLQTFVVSTPAPPADAGAPRIALQAFGVGFAVVCVRPSLPSVALD